MDKEDLKAIAELLDTKLEPIKEQLQELEPIKNQVNKNAMTLEEVKSDIKTIVEVQKNHMDQNEKAHKEIIKPLDEKVDVIGLAVKDTSKNVKDIKEDLKNIDENINVMKEILGRHEVDIAVLKRRPV
ncbi:hypothetical protein [Clostridium sp.]|uniref:hypothetical protein n=1 Tax=Clostridium sp. TaxID=1506 RepID=UPI0035A109DA